MNKSLKNIKFRKSIQLKMLYIKKKKRKWGKCWRYGSAVRGLAALQNLNYLYLEDQRI